MSGPWDYALLCGVGEYIQRCPRLLPEDEEGLPPLLITTGETDSGGVCVVARLYLHMLLFASVCVCIFLAFFLCSCMLTSKTYSAH